MYVKYLNSIVTFPMNNLVYFAISGSPEFVKVLNIALQSVIETSPERNFDILILTTEEYLPNIPKFTNGIKSYGLPPLQGKYEFFNLLLPFTTKLRIFEYPEIGKYEKILYLDADILINPKRNVSDLFEYIEQKDILYAMSEREPERGQWWNIEHPAFQIGKYAPWQIAMLLNRGSVPFNTGVMGFGKNISEYFKEALNLILEQEEKLEIIGEQGFVNHVFQLNGRYSTEKFTKEIEIQPGLPELIKFKPNPIIFHFVGHISNCAAKLWRMEHFSSFYEDFYVKAKADNL